MSDHESTEYDAEQWKKKWELYKKSGEYEREKERVEKEFIEKLMGKMCDGDPDFDRTVDENLWELI